MKKQPFFGSEFADESARARGETPMGVSQWREHGKKFGYWDYFEKEMRSQGEADGARKELKRILKTANIQLMKPRKPFSWGDDTWTDNVPVIPRMLIDDRLAQLDTRKEDK